ncbi:uncharacterized protein MYCFIDRAFT_209505 [Pseudocercospora fijiensis CIRAD86]|uniref:Uncharacterized protein n=1 Tax=Pseudocercospora fijiensis (strain CIRAD86) TaxID=383855 RepID=N1Q926_PSEFD|nr:uncharacterized protein MYCFIDRAFT_209505 [Pseudocercospora fijiensis CIRAD86]EME87412.1 hypothetical protein MYCFIDRAFT_209505 [Pseudocercospora fijiensis CIRAD86]
MFGHYIAADSAHPTGGLKRPSPEGELHASKSNKRPLCDATRQHPTAQMTESELDETDDSDEDPYQTDEDSDPEAFALLEEFIRELTADQPKRFSRNDTLAIALQALPRYLWPIGEETFHPNS